MDPHKRSATIEVVDDRGRVLTVGRYGTDKSGYAAMLEAGRGYPDRLWAIEGCNGIGKHTAHRLVHDGETVVDVPAKLSAQARVFATGNGRKTDPVDAHSVAQVALRTPSLVRVEVDDDLVVLGMLVDRRDELGRAPDPDHQPTTHAGLGTLPRRGTAVPVLTQGPGDDRHHQAPRPRRQDPTPARGRPDRRTRGHRQEDQGRQDRPARAGPGPRIHPDGPDRDRAVWCRSATRRRRRQPPLRRPRHVRVANGTAPLDASSAEQTRHRLSRAGNRRINPALHIMAVVQLRHRTEGRAYFDAKKAAGKTPMEAMRALKRRLSNVVYTQMLADQKRREATGPGGHSGTTLQSSVTDLTPDIGSSDKPLPGPATTQPKHVAMAAP
jgi:transposase